MRLAGLALVLVVSAALVASTASKARDGERDDVVCGGGVDRVVADQRDRVAEDCERVTRR